MINSLSFYKSVLSVISLRVISALFLFVFYQQIAAKFGMQGAGYFGLIFSIQTIGVLFSNLGLNESIVKYISQAERGGNSRVIFQIIYTARSKVVPYCVLTTILIGIYLYIFRERTESFLQVSFIVVPIIFIEQNASILRGMGFIQKSWVLTGILVPLIMLILLSWGNMLIEQLINFYIISNWVVMLISFRIVNLKLHIYEGLEEKKINNERVYYWPLVKTSYSLYIIGIFNAIMEIDTILIGYFYDLEQVAVYSVAKKIAMSISLLLVAVNSILGPKLSVFLKEKRKDELILLLKNTFFLLISYAVLVLGCVISFDKEILLFFGTEFSANTEVLQILLIGQFVNIITGPVGYILIMNGNEKLICNIIVAINVLCLISYGVFTPIYGIIYTSWITTFRVIVQNCIFLFYAIKVIKYL